MKRSKKMPIVDHVNSMALLESSLIILVKMNSFKVVTCFVGDISGELNSWVSCYLVRFPIKSKLIELSKLEDFNLFGTWVVISV